MRTITIYSTSGRDGQSVVTDVTTWGALKGLLDQKGIQHNKMKAVVGETKHTLEAANAELPAESFTLFLMPIKTKSGVDPKTMSYKELRAAISGEIAKDKTGKAAPFFNEGKNYTNKTTDEMRALLAKWWKKLGGQEPAAAPSKEKVKTEEVAEAKEEAVKPVKAEEPAPDQKEVFLTKIGELRNNLALQIADIDEFLMLHTAKKGASIPTPEIKKDKLHKQAQELAEEFGDVQRY